MAWAFGAFVLVIFLALMVRVPAFRNSVLALTILTTLGAYVWYDLKSRNEKRMLELVTPGDLTIRDAVLSYMREPKEFVAVAKNNSARHAVESIIILVSGYECPLADSIEWQSCDKIAEDIAGVHSKIPAGQTRRIDAHIRFVSMPSIRGKFVWNYEI